MEKNTELYNIDEKLQTWKKNEICMVSEKKKIEIELQIMVQLCCQEAERLGWLVKDLE